MSAFWLDLNLDSYKYLGWNLDRNIGEKGEVTRILRHVKRTARCTLRRSKREMIARWVRRRHARPLEWSLVGLESVGILLFPSVFQPGVLWIQIDTGLYTGYPPSSCKKFSYRETRTIPVPFPAPLSPARCTKRKEFYNSCLGHGPLSPRLGNHA